MNIPIVLIIYNRPIYAKKILLSINKLNINKVYVIADGPKNNPNDVKLVKKTRKLLNKLSNKIKVIKIFSEDNLGLRKRIISGLNYVFKKEKVAIILEDDCIPTTEFFFIYKSIADKT